MAAMSSSVNTSRAEEKPVDAVQLPSSDPSIQLEEGGKPVGEFKSNYLQGFRLHVISAAFVLVFHFA